MALITVRGGNRSNSFITAAQADVYVGESPYPVAAWSALSVAEKEYRLMLAAKYMTNRLSWCGAPVYVNQALCFPRWFAETDTIEVPDSIMRAQALIAYGIIHRGITQITDPSTGPSTMPQASSMSVFGLSFSFGETTFTDQSAFERLLLSEHFHIWILLDDWLTTISMTPAPSRPQPLPEVVY